jgi:DNA-binding GntR family transcriptional regulator
MPMKPVTPTSVVNLVAHEVRAAITKGELRPGQSFSIRELQDRLGVSQIPVREALRQLESDGLIELRAGRSAQVRPLSIGEVDEIYGLRLLIEPELAGRSVPLLTTDDIAEAELELARMSRVGVETSVEEFWAAHDALHFTLMRPAMGAWSVRILEQLWLATRRYTHLIYEERAALGQLYGPHRELVDIAEAGAQEQMRERVTRHLENSAQRLRVGVEELLEAGESSVS